MHYVSIGSAEQDAVALLNLTGVERGVVLATELMNSSVDATQAWWALVRTFLLTGPYTAQILASATITFGNLTVKSTATNS